MEITKRSTILITIFLLSSFLHAQDGTLKFNADIDYPIYEPIGRVLEYGMIRDGVWFIPINNDSVNCIVASDSLQHILSKHCIPSSYKKVWSCFEDSLFLASIDYQFIYYGPFCQDSTNVVDFAECNDILSITPIGEYIYSFSIALKKGDYRYYPSNSIGYKLKKTINIDFDIENQDSIFLYFRDKDSFSIFKMPTEVYPTEVKVQASYAFYNYDEEYPPHKYSEIFSSKNVYENAIEDELFFEGDFKVIKQKNNWFIFNLQNGRIYIIAEKTIIHIGNIELNDIDSVSPKIFVEDKDNEEVLINLPVIWKNTECPKPQIKVLIP